jgi:RNase adapter protein RapZ
VSACSSPPPKRRRHRLDTTDLRPVELREELRRRFGTASEPVLTLVSFGFGHGISRTADLVFDIRFLANPYWVDELRPLTGADRPVRDYVAEIRRGRTR